MIVKLSNSLYRKFCGENPPTAIKGFASVIGDAVVAVGGISLIAGEYFVIFGVNDNFDKRDIIRGWKEVKGLMDENKTYYALIDSDLDSANGLLLHFGFEHYCDEIYVFRG